jgi:hypothetical protein
MKGEGGGRRLTQEDAAVAWELGENGRSTAPAYLPIRTDVLDQRDKSSIGLGIGVQILSPDHSLKKALALASYPGQIGQSSGLGA